MSATEKIRGVIYQTACRHLALRQLLFRGIYAATTARNIHWPRTRIRCSDSAALAAETPPACVIEPIRGAIALSTPRLLQSPDELPPLDTTYTLPGLYRTTFHRATVFAGVVLTADGRLPKDLCPDLGTPPDWHRVCELRRLPPAVRVQGELVVLSAFGNAFYHWVLDSLPRLSFLSGPPTGQILLENDSAFTREYLAMAGIAPDRILCPTAWSHFAPDRVIVPSLPGISGCPPPETVTFLRQLRDRALGTPGVPRPRRRLYVTRHGSRAVANEAEIRTRLARHGFEPIDAGAMSVRAQMAAFTDAEIVVGAHGGALTNLVYCAPGTPVIELMPASYINPCFRLLCWSAGLVYGGLTCPSVGHKYSVTAECARSYTVQGDALDRLVARGLRQLHAS